MLTRTTSGGVTINGTLLHYVQDDLPFGGVGASGVGAYHGIEGFRTFSHQKAVFDVGRWNGGALLRPPFGGLTNLILSWMLRPVSTTPGHRSRFATQTVIHASGRTRVGSVDRRRTLAVVVAAPVGGFDSSHLRRAAPVVFRWKAHPVELRSAVVTSDRPHCFAITADGRGVHAERTFTLRPTRRRLEHRRRQP